MSRSHELQQHIQQLGDIRNIINSMKNLAYMETHKLARFLDLQQQVVTNIKIVANDFLSFHPYLTTLEEEANQVYLLIGSERGFCGDFNKTLIAHVATEAHYKLIGVGRKLCQQLEQNPHAAELLDGPNIAEEVPEVINHIVSKFYSLQQQHRMLGMTVLYHDSETDRIVNIPLLPPFQQPDTRAGKYSYSPGLNLPPATFYAELVDQYLFAMLHEIFYSSLMAENHSRLQHMEGAVKHLDDQIDKLRRKSNLFRQEEITEEIEVILLAAENFR
jgi:F-type H+-transporting ATPase subunit gamma